MADGTDEFMTLRNNPAYAGLTDEQIKQMILSPSGAGSGNLDFGMQSGQGMNLGGSPTMSSINYGNSLQDPYAYNSMSLASGSNIEGSTGPNQYQSATDGTFTNYYEEAPGEQAQQLTTTGPSNVMNTVSQGVNLVNQIKPLLGSGGLKGLIGKLGLSGGAGAGAAGAGAGAGAGLAALTPLAPLALGAGALLYMKHRKKKRKEKREAKEEAQYKSRKLEQKQDLIDANQDYMEMASKYNNTYDIS